MRSDTVGRALECNSFLPQVLEEETHFSQGSAFGPQREKALLQIRRPMNGTQMFQEILFLVIMNCTCLALLTNPEVLSERDLLTPLYR